MTRNRRVPRATSVYAAGRIINPRTARSQFLGGFCMGLSMALHEESIADERRASYVNHDLAAEGPFGRTIAHGYLTVGLLIPLFAEILDVQGVRMGINYGLDRLRFPEPILVGSRIRLRAVLNRVEDVPRGGVQAHLTLTVEIEGTDKPGCIADALYRYYA